MDTDVTIQIKTTAERYNEAEAAFFAAFSAIEEVEKATSYFRDDSDVARLRNAPAGTAIHVAEPTWRALQIAKEIYTATEGTYDVTIGPLVELWGFGTTQKKTAPAQQAIEDVLTRIGFDNVCFIPSTHSISSRIYSLNIDLSSVAKGVAVDTAFDVLTNRGFYTVLVNAGGEIRALASNAPAWRIGIQVPDEKTATAEYIKDRIISLRNGSIATSGSYRRFLNAGGKQYSHILNPQTGQSFTTDVVSVSVYAPTCAYADAWATAFFTMSPEKATAIAHAHPSISCCILLRQKNTNASFRMRVSDSFPFTEHEKSNTF